jgi:hypothetical protein
MVRESLDLGHGGSVYCQGLLAGGHLPRLCLRVGQGDGLIQASVL